MPLQHSSQGVIKASSDRILHSGCQASFSWSLFDLIFACVILLLFPRPQLTRLSRPLSPSRWYLLFHPCVCHPQTLSLSVWFFSPRSLMIAQRQHPSSAESRGGSSSWKGLMVIQTISWMGMGIICFLMSPSDSLKEDACMSLSVWGGTLLCVALEAFTLLYEHSLYSSGPPSEKNEPCVSKNWREPVFHFLPPCKSKNFPNNCLLHTPNHFLFSALA